LQYNARVSLRATGDLHALTGMALTLERERSKVILRVTRFMSKKAIICIKPDFGFTCIGVGSNGCCSDACGRYS
jgi:hypothetical protein